MVRPLHKRAIALVGAELIDQIDPSKFTDLVRRRFQLNISQTLEWSDQTAIVQNALAQLRAIEQGGEPLIVVLLEEAWQPPIAEKLQGIRSLRESLGTKPKIIVVLVGRPENGNALTKVKPNDKRVWERQIQSLGDIQLRLENLIDHE